MPILRADVGDHLLGLAVLAFIRRSLLSLNLIDARLRSAFRTREVGDPDPSRALRRPLAPSFGERRGGRRFSDLAHTPAVVAEGLLGFG